MDDLLARPALEALLLRRQVRERHQQNGKKEKNAPYGSSAFVREARRVSTIARQKDGEATGPPRSESLGIPTRPADGRVSSHERAESGEKERRATRC